ncbi:MAG TPA: SHOCT domain-containing protein [Stellaceae bacterium]|jgi:putative membrane protein
MTRIRSFLTAATVTAFSTLPALAQQTGNTAPPDYGYHRHMYMWHGFIGPIVWIIVIFGLVALFTRFGFWGRHGYRYHRMGGALDILEERFARGEIDKAEFEEKRKFLTR